ncbi:MAG TPA: type II secretion system F family protein [Oligoflexia bacterium]|nr:type II secretion system F family protein [Oligoflexia bacterium]
MNFALLMDSFTVVVAMAFVFVSVYLTARAFFHSEETRSARELLGEQNQTKKSRDAIVKYSRLVFSRYFVPVVANLKIEEVRKKTRRKLISAGMTEEFTADEFLAFKAFMIFGAPAATGIFIYIMEIPLPWYGYFIVSLVGFFYPDMMVKGAIEGRQKEVRKALPFVVDLLALSTEAGLDFMQAVGKVVEKATPSPLIDELSQVMREIKVGASRSEALKEMGVRLNMREVSSFVAILVSADQMGASIGKILRQQSEAIRNERFVNAESQGAKAAQKVMGPLFVFIIPAIIIMIFGPVALQMMKGGGMGP